MDDGAFYITVDELDSSLYAPPSPTHTAPNITKQNQSGRETERRGETYDIKVCQVITYDATPLQIRPLWLNIAR